MSFRYVLTGEFSEQPAVYKLHFGKKYFTWKGKNLKQSIETICKDLDRFIGRGCSDDHMLKKVVEYVTRGRILFCRVEVLLQTDNVTQLLDFEKLTLAKGKEDPECLNVKFEAHIPKWMTDQATVENKPASNKAITATISPSAVSNIHSGTKIKPTTENKPSTGKLSLLDILAKHKK